MSTTLEGLPGAPQARLGEVARFFGALIGPRAAFEDIERKPTFVLPLVVLTILSLLATFIIVRRVGVDRIIRQGIEQSSAAERMTPEQIEQAVERSHGIASVLMWVASAAGPALLALLMAAVYLLLLNLMEAGINFSKVLGVAAHALVPRAVSAVLTILVILLKDPADINIENPLGSNLGILMDPMTSSKPLYAIASSLDLFTFWSLALLAVGFSVITKTFSIKKSAVIAVIPWVIYVLGKVGLAALRG